MTKTAYAKSAVLLAAAVVAVCLTGCPIRTFTIKLVNTGEFAITGAYIRSATSDDWGENLLDEDLLAGDTVLIERVAYRQYDIRCTFDGLDYEGQPAVLEQLENWPPGHGLDCVTWRAGYTDSSWSFGYNWGCEDI